MEIEETEDIEYLVDSKYDIIKKLESSVKSGDSLINIIPYYKNNNKYVKQIINNFILTRKEKFKEEIKNELCNIKIYKLISLIEVCEEALLMCFEELRKSLWNINELFEKKT
ncbi:hypothetical protein [Candidatus Ruminimicrobium bovinum]|uniref:hypothetical protein n=1 Tax=Candidatus Ruminimicrobium bovinum TaxID=3242779 RepID=UPI0039B8F94A